MINYQLPPDRNDFLIIFPSIGPNIELKSLLCLREQHLTRLLFFAKTWMKTKRFNLRSRLCMNSSSKIGLIIHHVVLKSRMKQRVGGIGASWTEHWQFKTTWKSRPYRIFRSAYFQLVNPLKALRRKSFTIYKQEQIHGRGLAETEKSSVNRKAVIHLEEQIAWENKTFHHIKPISTPSLLCLTGSIPQSIKSKAFLHHPVFKFSYYHLHLHQEFPFLSFS